MKLSEKEFNIQLGRRLRSARKRAALTQEQVAAHFGISQDSISRYEKGKAAVPVSRLVTFSKLYSAPVTFFFMNSSLE